MTIAQPGVARAPASPTIVCHRRRDWLLRQAARWVLSGLPGAAMLSAGALLPATANVADLVARPVWWREEAGRGLAELETALLK